MSSSDARSFTAEEVSQLLNNQMMQLSSSHNRKTLDTSGLPIFEASSPEKDLCRAFLRQMELHFHAHEEQSGLLSDRVKILETGKRLRGPAADWFGQQDYQGSFVDFKASITSMFGMKNPRQTAWDKWRKMTAESTRIGQLESVAGTFLSLINELDAGNRRNPMLPLMFNELVPKRVRTALVGNVPADATLQEFVDLAVEMDKQIACQNSSFQSFRPVLSDRIVSTSPAVSSLPPGSPMILSALDESNKLSPAERTRRLANRLCLYCGEPGHRIADCPGKGQGQ